MKIGTQIIALEGWKCIPKEVVFHFLCSNTKHNRVLLVNFSGGTAKSSAKADLLTVNRLEFERGCLAKTIVPMEQQLILPPWLRELEGVDLSQIDRYRPSFSKHTHQQRVEDRYIHIQLALGNISSILFSKDPVKEINRYARKCKPVQNESRFRLWLLTYLCFGRNIWTLLPPYHHSGSWSREKFPDKKFGAPNLAYGKKYGNGMNQEIAEQCLKSYLKRAAPGVKMSKIYEEAMISDFKCQVFIASNKMKIYLSPDGKPFPTIDQFRYQIKKILGKETIQKTLYGKVRYRTRLAASKGKFTEEISNLMERVEADGYYTSEKPRGYLDGTTLPPMCVVIGRDVLSGMKVGIGFSLGAERNEAYKMMLFSMAVPKSFFCQLFGVTCKHEEWPSEGLSGHFSIDRGPGARRNLIESLASRFPIRDMAPSWSGQSKATVESSHPRDVALEGMPTFQQSRLTPVELAKREILALILYNDTADMESRIDPDSDLAMVTPSPLGLWNYYDNIFRNDAQSMSIDDAIRTFLTCTKFTLQEDGLYLGARRYISTELSDLGLFDQSGEFHNVETKLTGYILEMCIRHAWVEINNKLYMLEAMLRIRGDEEDLWMSLSELNQWEEARKSIKSAYRIHKSASSSEFRQRYYEDTGKSWDSAIRRAGKPRKSSLAKQEAKEAKQTNSLKRVA